MKRAALILTIITCAVSLCAQQSLLSDELVSILEAPRYLRVMFYNCENFFDVDNDPVTNDDEFTPDGEKHWNKYRFYDKRDKISKVIVTVGGWNPPDIVGLCEIESRKVMESLTYNSGLRHAGYRFLHKESPDARGIDVALLYKPTHYKPFNVEFIPVKVLKNGRGTRDILLASGLTVHGDTLHIFVNHWPSRWGGQVESDGLRRAVAGVVRQKVDSLININPRSNILIMGDLNDYPDNNSVCIDLRAHTRFNAIEQSELYNLAYYMQFVKGWGTHKYNGQWGILDQMIISGALLDGQNVIYTSKDDIHVFNPDFLLERDEANVGYKPFRTYLGYQYIGGFRDHLPGFINIYRKENDD